MSPEAGYERAQYHLVGVKIVMGPVEAREELVAPRRAYPLGYAYGDGAASTPVASTASSWFEYDCARLVGRKNLNAWVLHFCRFCACVRGTPLPAREDVDFLLRPNTSLTDVKVYLEGLHDGA
jgi:hypothetical protein